MNQASAHSIRRLAEKYTTAWCSQDPDLVAACYAKHGSLTVNNDPPAQGRQAISEVARGFMTSFPDMKVSLDDLELRETGAIYHWTLTGNNNGPGGTGRSVKISGYEIWQIDSEGLIACSEGYFDNADYFRQLGL